MTLPVYPATKATLTMLTVQYARALDGILVNAADPGFTATDFNSNRGTQTVAEGTDAIVRLATLPKDGPTGTFQDRNGTVPGEGQHERRDILAGAPEPATLYRWPRASSVILPDHRERSASRSVSDQCRAQEPRDSRAGPSAAPRSVSR